VIEERAVRRLGSRKEIGVDVRLLAATNRPPQQAVAEGKLRSDLLYRLNVFGIHLPPLGERKEDLPLLAQHLVTQLAEKHGRPARFLSRAAVEALQFHNWPGNIRELRNVVERAMITATAGQLTITVPRRSAAATTRSVKLVDVEREHIRTILESTRWRIRGKTGAAEMLGLKPTTLETRMAKLGLTRPSRAA